MPHPSLGLPPRDRGAAMPGAAARLRTNRERLARIALQAAVRDHPRLSEAYDDAQLRLLLRDYDQHIEQLARALESGDNTFVVNYGEWLVPIYRRRRIPMKDLMALLEGLRSAAATVMTPSEREVANVAIDAWLARLRFHRRLPGDHRGNALVRFFWKGAGILDDEVV